MCVVSRYPKRHVIFYLLVIDILPASSAKPGEQQKWAQPDAKDDVEPRVQMAHHAVWASSMAACAANYSNDVHIRVYGPDTTLHLRGSRDELMT